MLIETLSDVKMESDFETIPQILSQVKDSEDNLTINIELDTPHYSTNHRIDNMDTLEYSLVKANKKHHLLLFDKEDTTAPLIDIYLDQIAEKVIIQNTYHPINEYYDLELIVKNNHTKFCIFISEWN